MNSDKELKNIVRQKYTEIALTTGDPTPGCCGPVPSCCDPAAGVNFSDDYTALEGYVPGADLQLGCGLPTASSGIRPGHTVLDLGSGAGNDAFVARALVGPEGRVLGLDFSKAMVEKARRNAAGLGHDNVEFMLGDIEDIPLPDSSVDVVISNCVLNLVPDKAQAFGEVFRVLKPGGHFSISDVVLEGVLPEGLAQAAALYTGCVAGALERDRYFEVIRQAGFPEVITHARKPITVPEALAKKHLTPAGYEEFRQTGVGIFSVTVGGTKPAAAAD